MNDQKVIRCSWANTSDKLMQEYHDHEWGKLNLNEQYLFEKFILDSFQSGLSWSTILHKRANFRQAFANFDVNQIAKFDQHDFNRLMQDSGIIRNQLKIRAAINNARVIANWHQNGQTFVGFLKQYFPQPLVNHPHSDQEIPAQTLLSKKISLELKKTGFKFVGPTTVYSFLQAVGLINDHLESCFFKYQHS